MKQIHLIFWVVMVLIAGAGCERQARVADEAERDHPLMRKAREFEAAGNDEAARLAYQSLLDRDGRMARAHLALALLLDGHGGNPLDAIYHYQRYLALRPDTEKRRMIESHVRAAQLAYVGTVFTNEAAVLRRMGEIQKENDSLKIRVANLETLGAQLRLIISNLRTKYETAAVQAERSLEALPLPVSGPRSAGRLVQVQAGDSLRKLSVRYYGDQGRWREIFDANRSVLKRPEDIRPGQTLLIPERTHE